MKEPENGVDKDVLNEFREKVGALARETFSTDESGDLPVDIRVIDRTRFWVPHMSIIPHDHLVDGKEEELRLLYELSVDSEAASEILRRALQINLHNQQEELAEKKLSDAMVKLGTELNLPLTLTDSTGGKPREGYRWYPLREESGRRAGLILRSNIQDRDEQLVEFVTSQVAKLRTLVRSTLISAKVVYTPELSLFTVYGLLKEE